MEPFEGFFNRRRYRGKISIASGALRILLVNGTDREQELVASCDSQATVLW